ncbi:mitochondrial inner membrane protein-domain-containing protein [Filobasidium floriforme]|uniref:mitochondrial inner membrane protein-domain-containing protein n=1 Tax=Filobasidium floriforme TaxID=5210 RepID=UPI001E8EC5F7|nr:mitochondrial inner membrane protein-domain-containing protein [Filobasidium floriforme]KAH8090467.1 mitochondrial inner membrane protein-domain-containing protein [Filobasidium floriforme]
MYRQARLISARPLAVQRQAIRRFAIETPTGPTSTGLPPKPPTPLSAGNARPVVVSTTTATPNSATVGSGVAPIPAKPVVVVDTKTNPRLSNSSSEIPPPPPPPPAGKPKSRWARKFLIYLTLGTLVFYPTSALISTHSDRYRDFFTSTFPLAESLVEFADENDWDELSLGSITSGAKGLSDKVTGSGSNAGVPTISTAEGAGRKVSQRAQEAKEVAADKTKEAGHALSDKIEQVQAKAARQLEQAKAALTPSSSPSASPVSTKVDKVEAEAKSKSAELKRDAKRAAEKTSDSAHRVVENVKAEVGKAAEAVKSKTDELVAKLPTVPAFSEGVTELVSKAEDALSSAEHKAGDALNRAETKAGDALHRAESKAGEALHKVEDKVESEVDKAERAVKALARNKGGPVVDPAVQAEMVDTQRPRDVKASTGPKDKVVAAGGKKPWTGAPLPLGFEPPAGYYIPKTGNERKDVSAILPDAAVATPAAPANTAADAAKDPLVRPDPKTEGTPVNKPTLPLLAPRVAEFTSAEQEPIIAQLASTIDSLASSLSPTSSTKASMTNETDPQHVLSQAQTDLSSLSSRMQALKDKEQAALQDLAEKKKNEFEAELKRKESEWTVKEGQMVDGWKEEREKLVEGWRKVLDRELEGQRVGIEQRLREEVIAQGIELQRRWLRSIKAQVEEERGGRLSKLDNLTTSFKQLERITLDNSSQLDANVSLHTLWSALRAVQAKVDKGGVAFDDELRVLKTAATAAASSASDEQSRQLVSAMIESIEQSHAATEGIKSFPALSSWFSTTLAPKIQSVSLVPAEHEAGVLSHLASAGLSKVLFRPRAGWVEGDDVGAVLARAEYLLNEKDLDGAARQVNQLQGWAGKLAGDWLREARKRLEVEQALQVMATEATLASLLLV